MKLASYLTARDEREAAFARRSGVAQRTINRICAGARCNVDTAVAIIQATHKEPTPANGTVGLEDLTTGNEAAA